MKSQGQENTMRGRDLELQERPLHT